MKPAAIVLLVAGVSCAQPKPQAVVERETQVAEDQLRKRLWERVDFVDDGISDASTIAFALTNECDQEYQALLAAICDGLDNDQQRAMFLKKANGKDMRVQVSLAIVVKNRANKAHSHN